MRVNRWASLLALLGVLLHAGLVVRHSGAVLAAALQQEHAVPFGAICYVFPDHSSGGEQAAEHPESQKNASKCPICTGAVPGVALTGAAAPVIYAPASYVPPLAVSARAAVPRPVAALPPSRAPPATV